MAPSTPFSSRTILRSGFRGFRHNTSPRLTRPIPHKLHGHLPPQIAIKKETLPHYEPSQYCPIHIGDVLNARYRVAGKLGYGAHSTSWVCHDTHQPTKYPVVKVSTSIQDCPTATHREFKVYEHLSNISTDSLHPGQCLIRELYDTFELDGPSGQHQCLVQQAMHMSLLEMMKLSRGPLDLPFVKMIITRILMALDFLHTDAGVIHTDLHTDNLMLTIEDPTMLSNFAELEKDHPTPRKIIHESRTIYQSRILRLPAAGASYGVPILCDFGEAVIGTSHETDSYIQPHVYRAPEVIFEMLWGPAVDIWNLWCLTWDLFEGDLLFDKIFHAWGEYDPFKHLAPMVALLGPPPSEFVSRSETTEQRFGPDGAWNPFPTWNAVVPPVSLERREKRLVGREKQEFLKFMRYMLRRMPEERRSAKQLLGDPWLQ